MTQSGKILITGANGFIAQHIIFGLLKQGFSVIGTVRTQKKADKLICQFSKIFDDPRLDTALIPQIMEIDAFDGVLRQNTDIKFVINTASFTPDDFEGKLDTEVVLEKSGAINLLNSIKKLAPQIEKVVHTTSMGAIVDMSDKFNMSKIVTEDTWNPLKHFEKELDFSMAFKSLEEKACWKIAKEGDVNFGFTTIAPPLCLGPTVFDENASPSILHPVIQALYNFIVDPESGSYFSHILIGNHCCDVRDIAKLHIRALEREADGKRLLFFSDFISRQGIADVVDKHFPEFAKNINRESLENGEAIPLFNLHNEKTMDFVGKFDFIPFETQVVDTIKQILKEASKEG